MKKHTDVNGYRLDSIDHSIIDALKEDGRMPFAEIARRLDVSPGMVRQRYVEMVDKDILQVVPVTNPTIMGYNMMALIGVRVDGDRLLQAAQEIATLNEVIYLVMCTGTYDILVEVVCQDNPHLLTFLADKLRVVKGVRNTETFLYLEIIKESYI
jgi:Lrp/AsnC family transcriptional regulator, regulator for asnA, asnC and gidA